MQTLRDLAQEIRARLIDQEGERNFTRSFLAFDQTIREASGDPVQTIKELIATAAPVTGQYALIWLNKTGLGQMLLSELSKELEIIQREWVESLQNEIK